MGSASATEVLLVVTVLAFIFGVGGVTVGKGHIALFAAGFIFPPVWAIAAPRLAKPNSPWARRFYGPEKTERSANRYPGIKPSRPSRAPLAATIGFGLIAAGCAAGAIDGLTG